MAVRTPSDLTDVLSKELAWRKRELTSVFNEIQKARRHMQPVLLRSAVCLLYAHWEGFVRTAATAYVELVARRRLRIGELKHGFVALSLRAELVKASQSRRVADHGAMVQAVLDESRAAQIRWRDAVSTRSNLTYETLEDILYMLDFDASRYATKRALINEKLVHRRNSVAHGEYLDIDGVEYRILQANVLELVEWFRDDVESAATSELYRRAPIGDL